ncbi:MAG TPA: class I SAM-dependent methyltransferase [Actinobacteria bacterium]|nr:class I SAM-dependent methyltransferase [Actinomycetota bacterium]
MDALAVAREVYERLAALGTDPPRMRAWTGEEWGPADAAATVVLEHPGALRALLLPPSDLTAGEAYIYGDVDVEGDIFSVLAFARSLTHLKPTSPTAWSLLRLLRRLPAESRRRDAVRPTFHGILHSLRRDREAVRYHYDTGNDFFATFLGETMVYSCAYFLDPAEPLDVAQRRKLDVICRKLELRPGERFLDVGCGWGSLVLHAASRYGVEATGVTLSSEQAEYARLAAKRAGVDDRVTILERDYRELDGTFDAIASVGMVEHVGARQLPRYFRRLRSMLEPGGRLLNHGIVTRERGRRLRRRPTFISTYVFPDGELEPIEEVVDAAMGAGFELRDAESLRTSYALTLRRWVANLETNHDAAVAATDETTYRIWRAYMAASAILFEHAGISVFQLLLTDPARRWTFGRRWMLADDDT